MVYNEDKPKSFFLMTTALEEFWDTSKPSIFLGEWCRRYGRKLFWEKLDAEVIKSPWADDLTLELATGYVNDKYEWLLAALSGALNRLHKTCHNERYWRILLGPWLLMYVPVMYDRSMYIKAALAAHPDLSTIVLSEDSYVIPQDTFDFFHLASNDHYNLQIYSRIFKSLGKDFPSQKERIITPDILLPRPSLLIGLMMSIKPVLNSFTKIFRNRASVLFRESYFPLSVEMQIILKSKSRIFPFLAKKNNKIVDSSLRLDLSLTAEASDTFEELLYKQVIMDIPRCYVEGYKQFSDFAFNSNSNITKAVLSSISWYYDESFKFFAASSSEKGIALLGIQHGGNYGSIFTHPGEKHEISITDRYYSWGWDDANNKKIVPMPSSKLSGRSEIKADKRKEGILFVSTSTCSRYMTQFPYTPEAFLEYLSWQKRFIIACNEKTLNDLYVRLRWDDSGWDIRQRWKDYLPSLREDSFDIPLMSSIDQCRLFVSDNLQTTFLEALSVNKPSILFWDDSINKLRPEAIPYYDKLRSVGILYDCPESAAEAISLIYDNLEVWWNEPVRQEARLIFCQRFALIAPNCSAAWVQELETVVSDSVISKRNCIPTNV